MYGLVNVWIGKHYSERRTVQASTMVEACTTVEAHVELGRSKCYNCAFSEMHGFAERLDVRNFMYWRRLKHGSHGVGGSAWRLK